ncbi:MAG TPA: type 2 lanthipeptide synthetase LanM family protein [Blastocatellia bacterium]|nr:type 2 lanthipeptide synthetase LanM family protein [Blastocatellia bacterium]
MNELDMEGPRWLDALTLGERAAALGPGGPDPGLEWEIDWDLAERRVQRWRSQSPLGDDTWFARRLSIDQVTEEQFKRLVGIRTGEVCKQSIAMPGWVEELLEAFSGASDEAGDAKRIELQGSPTGGDFLVAIEPLIRRSRIKLEEGIRLIRRTYSPAPFDANIVIAAFVAGLRQQLMNLISPTMVLELNVARLEGVLKGNNPEQRYVSFLERLADPKVRLSLLQEYPVLARQIVVCAGNIVAASLEFLSRLCADWEVIKATLSPNQDPGIVSELAAFSGDAHRGGRSVTIATFSEGFKLVYKPRSMAVDRHFAELLALLGEWGNHPDFRTPAVIDRGTYGWTEFVKSEPCNSEAEARRFYQRQGGYLAILYFLEATDFHLENLIAAGEYPILVDLEALFHPRVPVPELEPWMDPLAVRVITHSVLRVALLPHRLWPGPGRPGVDLSGLGGEQGQLSPRDVPAYESAGTDEMRVVRKRIRLPGAKNRPRLGDVEINVLDYTEEVVKGFCSLYELMMDRQQELVAECGPFDNFARDEVRVVVRPTMNYALALVESYHPDFLRNALDRDRLLDRFWAIVESRPNLAYLVPAEQSDLRRGDVPFFVTRPNSTAIWSSTGERTADFFKETSLDMVKSRLANASKDDMARQVWFIRASMTSLATGHAHNVIRRYGTPEPEVSSPEEFMEEARAVGDQLDMLAIQEGADICWIGLTMVEERNWNILPLGIDLYDGSTGILFFLAYLGHVTREERYSVLARKALDSILRRVRATRSNGSHGRLSTTLGAFSGWGGVIYALSHLGSLWNDPELLSEAEMILEETSSLVEEDKQLDIIGGCAGFIGALASLYHCKPSRAILDIAAQCGDRLIHKASPMGPGIAWKTPIESSQPLAGFSHGAAGIAWALQELGALTGEHRFASAARQAVAYERSVFSELNRNWPDFRLRNGSDDNSEPRFSMTWCNGAPGIALGRLRSLARLEDSGIRADAEIALNSIVKSEFSSSHCLCHGALGNVDPLIEASLSNDGSRWLQPRARAASYVLNSIRTSGWVCGAPLAVETPGLLTGLAGIGYGLLRLADPLTVPSVLALAPPPPSHPTQVGGLL